MIIQSVQARIKELFDEEFAAHLLENIDWELAKVQDVSDYTDYECIDALIAWSESIQGGSYWSNRYRDLRDRPATFLTEWKSNYASV